MKNKYYINWKKKFYSENQNEITRFQIRARFCFGLVFVDKLDSMNSPPFSFELFAALPFCRALTSPGLDGISYNVLIGLTLLIFSSLEGFYISPLPPSWLACVTWMFPEKFCLLSWLVSIWAGWMTSCLRMTVPPYTPMILYCTVDTRAPLGCSVESLIPWLGTVGLLNCISKFQLCVFFRARIDLLTVLLEVNDFRIPYCN